MTRPNVGRANNLSKAASQAGEKRTMENFPSVHMWNCNDNETAPAHLIGHTEDGRPIYQSVDGWQLRADDILVGQNMVPDELGYKFDADGNYVLMTCKEALHDRLNAG